MKKEKVLIGLGVATAMVTGFNNNVKADETIMNIRRKIMLLKWKRKNWLM